MRYRVHTMYAVRSQQGGLAGGKPPNRLHFGSGTPRAASFRAVRRLLRRITSAEIGNTTLPQVLAEPEMRRRIESATLPQAKRCKQLRRVL